MYFVQCMAELGTDYRATVVYTGIWLKRMPPDLHFWPLLHKGRGQTFTLCFAGNQNNVYGTPIHFVAAVKGQEKQAETALFPATSSADRALSVSGALVLSMRLANGFYILNSLPNRTMSTNSLSTFLLVTPNA